MANKSQSTQSPTKSKTTVVTDNRKVRKPEACAKLMALGVPKALAEDFPLTPHLPTKRWCKKLKTPNGWKIFYFGSIDNWQAALDRYSREKADLIAGRTPETRNVDGLRLLDFMNRFLHAKRTKVSIGKLTMRSWYDYHRCGERLLKFFGKDRLVENLGPADFEKLLADYSRTWGLVRISNEINLVRTMFAWAFENELLSKPLKFGSEFKRASKEELRKHKNAQTAKLGARMFEPEELRRIIDAADPCMKAMVTLACNSGMGNTDLAMLPRSAVDLEKKWVHFPRPKSGVDRKFPLWDETVQLIREWLVMRPPAKNPADDYLLFLTKQRRPWHRLGRFVEEDGATRIKGIDNPLSKSFKVLLIKLNINGKRGFYHIRHGFESIAGDARDQVAVDAVMGHADPSMGANYRERIDPERLHRVVQHVHRWLFGNIAQQEPAIIPISKAQA